MLINNYCNRQCGWPDVAIDEFEGSTLALAFAANTAISNLPDVASIVVYVTMLRHFNNSVTPDVEGPQVNLS